MHERAVFSSTHLEVEVVESFCPLLCSFSTPRARVFIRMSACRIALTHWYCCVNLSLLHCLRTFVHLNISTIIISTNNTNLFSRHSGCALQRSAPLTFEHQHQHHQHQPPQQIGRMCLAEEETSLRWIVEMWHLIWKKMMLILTLGSLPIRLKGQPKNKLFILQWSSWKGLFGESVRHINFLLDSEIYADKEPSFHRNEIMGVLFPIKPLIWCIVRWGWIGWR